MTVDPEHLAKFQRLLAELTVAEAALEQAEAAEAHVRQRIRAILIQMGDTGGSG